MDKRADRYRGSRSLMPSFQFTVSSLESVELHVLGAGGGRNWGFPGLKRRFEADLRICSGRSANRCAVSHGALARGCLDGTDRLERDEASLPNALRLCAAAAGQHAVRVQTVGNEPDPRSAPPEGRRTVAVGNRATEVETCGMTRERWKLSLRRSGAVDGNLARLPLFGQARCHSAVPCW